MINARLGAELTESDQLIFDQIAEAAVQDEELQQASKVNSREEYQLLFKRALESLFIERIETNEELFAEYIGNQQLQELVSNWLGKEVYGKIKQKPSQK